MGGVALSSVCLGREKKVLRDLSFQPPDRVTSLLSLEHLNVNVPEWNSENELFWMKGLGFASDSRALEVCKGVQQGGGQMQALVWANAGLQQIHIPVGEPKPMDLQTPPGFVGLVYSDIVALRSNLKALSIDYSLVSSQETVNVKDVGPPAMKVRSPTGVSFVVHGIRSQSWLTPNGWMKTKDLEEQEVSLPSLTPSVCLGIPYMRFNCPYGSARGLARFYEAIFRTKCELKRAPLECWVPVGASQWLIYREVPSGEPVPYDGYHVAIYINDFVGAYRRARALGLVWNNPRFPQTYDTEDQAVSHAEFRILRLVDPESSLELCQLEHEIRAACHPGFCAKAWLQEKAVSKQ